MTSPCRTEVLCPGYFSCQGCRIRQPPGLICPAIKGVSPRTSQFLFVAMKDLAVPLCGSILLEKCYTLLTIFRRTFVLSWILGKSLVSNLLSVFAFVSIECRNAQKRYVPFLCSIPFVAGKEPENVRLHH